MIIKLDTAIFRVERDFNIESVKPIAKPLTLQQRVNADRIVIAILFVVAITGTILFQNF